MRFLKVVGAVLLLALSIAIASPTIAIAEDVVLTPKEHKFLSYEVVDGTKTLDFGIKLNVPSALHIYLDTFDEIGSVEPDGQYLVLQLCEANGNVIDTLKETYDGYKSMPLPAGTYLLRLVQSAPAEFTQSISFSAWADTFHAGTDYQVFLPNNRDVASAPTISLDKEVAGRFEWWEAGSANRYYDKHYYKFELSEPTNIQVQDLSYKSGETRMSLVDSNGSPIKSAAGVYDPGKDTYNGITLDCGLLQPGTYYLCYESMERPRYDHNAYGSDFTMEFLVGHEMYRMYNPYTYEHLYTASATERASMIGAGWQYEGIMWYAPDKANYPVYRLYNPYTGDHHFTRSKAEYDQLGNSGWNREDIAFYSLPCTDDTTAGKPIFRLFNPYIKGAGTHHCTSSDAETNANLDQGWQYEGIGWAGLFWEEGYFWTNDLI